jgi:hypothetical protein
MDETNPFDMVLSKLWEMLLAHPRFERDVKKNCRIRFDDETNRDPTKDPVQDADFPEVMILPQTSSFNLHETSHTSRVSRQYTVMIATGDFRYTEWLGKVEWYVFVALLSWQERLTALRWKDMEGSFVKSANLLTATSGFSNPALNRNIKGWSAVWSAEVNMHFPTRLLLGEMAREPVLSV